MLKLNSRCVVALLVLASLYFTASGLFAQPAKTEAELIAMLRSPDRKLVLDALDRLPNWYPTSTNAFPYIKQLLRQEDIAIIPPPEVVKTVTMGKRAEVGQRASPLTAEYIARKAARSLGNYHAALDASDLQVIYQFFGASDPDVVLDGLKTLRGLNVPQAVPQILPLLKNENHNVVRDACRTLAVLGDKSIMPDLEPLLKDSRYDVKKDAKDAIAILQKK